MLSLGPHKDLQEQKNTVNRIYSRATGNAQRTVDYNIGAFVFIAFLIGEAVTAVDLNFLGTTVVAFFAWAWVATGAAHTRTLPCCGVVLGRTAAVKAPMAPGREGRGHQA